MKNHFAASELCPESMEKKHNKGEGTRRKDHKKVNALMTGEMSDSDTSVGSINVVSVDGVSSLTDPRARPILCNMIIDGKPVVHQIDPGATVCVIPLRHIGARQLRPETTELKLYNGSTISSIGRCKILVSNIKKKKK